ncbi:hypothetical protein JXM67_11725, partial [candidate division WOR-3 bacterium]|nr:hypothetical protein [candidate division WOR-3 bacterium]
ILLCSFFPDYTYQVLDPLSYFQQAMGHPPDTTLNKLKISSVEWIKVNLKLSMLHRIEQVDKYGGMSNFSQSLRSK